MLSCCYAECRDFLNVTLSVIMQCHYAECHYAQCRYAECRGALAPRLGVKVPVSSNVKLQAIATNCSSLL
jgi:hypothetical protein